MSRLRLVAGAVVFGAGAYALYARSAIRRFEDLDPQSAAAPGAFLDIDGLRIHYVGAGAGEPVVLIHGWNGSTFSFRYAIPALVEGGYRAMAIDLKGHGYSDRSPNADYSLAGQAELVRRVMDRLGVERATIVGHSMGGSVAMRLALRHPERVEALVLADSVTVRRGRRWAGLARALRLALPLIAPLTMHRASFRMRALRSAVHDPACASPEVADGYFRPFRTRGHFRALAAQVRDRARDEELEPAALRIPALVLWGEHDRWLPISNGVALAGAIAGARLVTVPSAGHLPLEEQPAVCNQAVLEFLASLRGASLRAEARTEA